LPGDASEDELDCELAELEAEYQANPPVLTEEDLEEIRGRLAAENAPSLPAVNFRITDDALPRPAPQDEAKSSGGIYAANSARISVA
jgi:hypothetical protein